ncbi:ABC transporter permease [Vitiosangium sp. GDMCC 1.1324]|uniref:MlaE family ABC transporter permease n=1 Tax=Vitiosangium sp. (strain GDMCC 1.1324) TaxID=2138576 RepID=UPI000D35635E|nr:ABC transporter permease [Vitiosangium sp. GDMCC 1.1324]PTL85690.1 ABC transporter permease [Vitiosangium sp. GDMCC 1.1324]
MNILAFFGAPALMLARSVRASVRHGLSWRECLRQLHEMGSRSTWLVMSGMAFFGAVLVTFADSQARKVTGNLPVVGPPYFELLVREFGPVVSALLAAARGGASHSAELSTMSVHEQVEALEMSAGDPYADLVAPRVVAGLVGVPLLCVVGTMAATLSAVATASWVFGVDGTAFMDARYVDGWDVVAGLAKGAGCGLYIPLAASVAGLSARGGAEAVGEATTRGVVAACFGCLLIDFVVALGFQALGV